MISTGTPNVAHSIHCESRRKTEYTIHYTERLGHVIGHDLVSNKRTKALPSEGYLIGYVDLLFEKLSALSVCWPGSRISLYAIFIFIYK